MTDSVNIDNLPAVSGSGPAGRISPLARFMKEARNARPLPTTTESDTDKSAHSRREATSSDVELKQNRTPNSTYYRAKRRNGRQVHKNSKTSNTGHTSTSQPKQCARTRANNASDDSTSNTFQSERPRTSSPLEYCVRCGSTIKYAHETRCEDCFADDSQRYHGRATRASITF